MRGYIKIGAGLAVGAFFLWLTLRSVDLAELGAAFSRIGMEQVLIALCFIVAAYALRILRWRMMLAAFAPDIRFSQVAGPFLASFAINNLVPLRAGDMARTFAFQREIGVAPSRVAASLIVERLLDLLALLLILAFGLSRLPAIDPLLQDVAIGALGIGVVALVIVLLAPRWIYRLLLATLRRLPASSPGALRGLLRFGMRLMHALPRLSSPVRFAKLLVLSLASWVLEGGVFWAAALHLGAPVDAALVALAAATVMTLAPGTPGHVGTFDFGAKLGYMSLGLTTAQATAAAVFAHVMVFAPVTAAGGVWLALRVARRRPAWSQVEG